MTEQILLVGNSKKWNFCARDYRKKITKILGTKIKLIGSGRTDKGVHARAQFANFKIEKKIVNYKKFLDFLNFFLKIILYLLLI